MVTTKFLFAALICLAPLPAAVLRNGSELEVRLLNPVGSRISHVGDLVRAAIITPVFDHERILIPAGATVSGVVDQLDRLGLGLRHTAARLDIKFTELHLSDSNVIPIPAQLMSVEEAREIVTDTGEVIGIHPAASFSTGVSGVFTLCFIGEPEFGLPILGFKFLAARSPDGEITFPAGTEMLLRVTHDVRLDNSTSDEPAVPPLTTRQGARFENILATLPQQQATRDGKHPSDLINIVLIGSRDAVERAFGAAGWHGSERHGVLALYHVYHCIVQRVAYSTAAMTNLKFNGASPDMSFQKSLDTLAKRHHVRLWREADSDVWLGAASEDIKYKFRALHITHGTDPEIDNERAKVVNDLAFAGCVDRGALIPRALFTTTQEDTPFALTDGDVAVVQLNACDHPRVMPPDAEVPRPVRIIGVARAILEDVARSNPVSVAYAMTNSMFAGSKTGANKNVQDSGAYTRAIAISSVTEASARVSTLH